MHHGERDFIVPLAADALFAAALRSRGVANELVTYPGAPHSFFDRKAADFGSESDDAWRRIREFILTRTPA